MLVHIIQVINTSMKMIAEKGKETVSNRKKNWLGRVLI